MKYKVLITPVEPSIDTHSNFSGVLADYEIEANSESEAGDVGVIEACCASEEIHRSISDISCGNDRQCILRLEADIQDKLPYKARIGTG